MSMIIGLHVIMTCVGLAALAHAKLGTCGVGGAWFRFSDFERVEAACETWSWYAVDGLAVNPAPLSSGYHGQARNRTSQR